MRYIPDIMREELDPEAPRRINQIDSLDMLLWPVMEYHVANGGLFTARPLHLLVENPKGGVWCCLSVEGQLNGKPQYNLLRSTSSEMLYDRRSGPFARSWHDDGLLAGMMAKVLADHAKADSYAKLADYGASDKQSRVEILARGDILEVAATMDYGYITRTWVRMAEGVGTKTPLLTDTGRKLLFEGRGLKAVVNDSWGTNGELSTSVSLTSESGALLTWKMASTLFGLSRPCGKLIATRAYDDHMVLLYRSPSGILNGYKFHKKEQSGRSRRRYSSSSGNGYNLQRILSGSLDGLLEHSEKIQWAPFMDQARIDDTIGRIQAATVAVALGVAQRVET